MIYKILRKLNLGGGLLSLAKPFLRAECTLPSLQLAEAALQALSPDPGNSCLHSKSREKSGTFDLDIIIPAYNVEKYIKRCIDSALNQDTHYKFRLIIVDDGSTDSTAAILNTYAEDERIMIIHQENRGLAGARNAGLSCSSSKHIMFLDSDDYLVQGSIELLMNGAIENDAAICEGAYVICNTEGEALSSTAHKAGTADPRRDLYGFACMKVFSAELFDSVCFPLSYLYEDSIMAQIIYPLSQSRGLKSYGITEPVYNYTVNPKGISHTGRTRPKCIDSLWITLQLHKDREKLGLEKDQDYYEYILNMITLSYRRAENQSEDVKKAMLVIWREFLEKEFSDFETTRRNEAILQQAVRSGNFSLYCAACKLI